MSETEKNRNPEVEEKKVSPETQEETSVPETGDKSVNAEAETGTGKASPEDGKTETEAAENGKPGADQAEEKANDSKNEASGKAASGSGDSKPGPKSEPKKEDEDLMTRYTRLMADFQNFRKRTDKERSDIYARANEGLMTELIPILDDFERALNVKDEAAKGMREGVEMIYKKYRGVLEKAGLKEIEAEGAVFDPNFHNAVQMCPAENGNSGKVARVLQKGYTLNGKVLRPSMVIVAE